MDLGNSFLEYDKYIERLRLLAESTYMAIEDLSYAKRKLWFETHTIPTHIKYYSLSSTMAGPIMRAEQYDLSPNAMINQENMGRHTPEYGFLRSSYYFCHKANKNKLQDGLIGLHESTFHPKIHMRLNKKQKHYETIELGVFATHHTALVHSALVEAERESLNSVDRRSMLRALKAQ